MALIRLGYGFAVKRMALTRRILLLGEPERVRTFCVRLRAVTEFRSGRHVGSTLSWSFIKAQRIWGIVIASGPEEHEIDQLMDCKLRGMRIFSDTTFQESYLGSIDLNNLVPGNLVTGRGYAAGRVLAVSKRLCDILIGCFMLILTVPLMPLTALAIKIDGPGPVFYRQRRVGSI